MNELKTEQQSITLKNGQVINVGDIVRPKCKYEPSYENFMVGGIFTSTTGHKCFYEVNPFTKVYYGNSGEVNEYKKLNKKKYFEKIIN